MALNLPDPAATAAREAAAWKHDPAHMITGPVDRVLADAPHLDRQTILAGATAFHIERMAMVPSATTYPESKAWVDHILAVEREMKTLGATDEQLAIRRSLGDYLTFRGYVAGRAPSSEKCRVVYDPDTTEGEFHAKNVDDPDTFWAPSSPMKPGPWKDLPAKSLVWDGVGSGMHIDDEPAELFPLSPPQMYRHHCSDVPEAVDFLTRYKLFWGGQNIVLHDAEKRSVAIEKSSYSHIEIFTPGPNGRSCCSGMVSRDPQSPQGKFHREKRAQYLRLTGVSDNCADAEFWKACDRAHHMLADLQASDRQLAPQDYFDLMTTPWPEGLNKNGSKFHPDQAYVEYTLMTTARAWTPTKQTAWRWQRGPKPEVKYPSTPETFTITKP